MANHANSLLDPVMLDIAAQRPVRFFAKAPLFDTPVLGSLMRALGMIPAYRGQDSRTDVRKNLESLERGAAELARGTVIGIFPEGKSHDSLHLDQIRSGAARMAVRAVAMGGRDLRVVPVGINYQRKQLFRSAVWIRIGKPVDVSAAIAAAGGDERAAVRTVTTEIEKSLKAVVINLEEPVFAPFLEELELLVPPRRIPGHRAISALRQRKRIADAMNHFLAHERGRAESTAGSIRAFRSRLLAAGLSMRSPVMRLRTWRLFIALASEAVWLAFWSPAALIGALFHIVPFTAVRLAARKIEDGPTTTALSRLGLGLPVYGLWYAGAWWALRSYFLPWVAWTVVGAMPFAGVLALTWAHRAREACQNWLAQWRVLVRPGQLADLRSEQARVREELSAFAADYARVVPPADLDTAGPRIDLRRATFRWAGIIIAAVVIFVAQNSWFKYRAGIERTRGLNIGGMSVRSLQFSLLADEATLLDIIAGIKELERRAAETKAEFRSGKRTWYRQADDDAARQLLLAYVNYRTALLRIVWKYQDYRAVGSERERLRAFLLCYTAAATLYSTSMKFVAMFDGEPNAMRKLNEPEPLWNIPAGLFDTIRRNLADPESLQALAAGERHYRKWHSGFVSHALVEGPPFAHFHSTIGQFHASKPAVVSASVAASVAAPIKDASATGKEALYNAQRFISTWIGDTKVRAPRGGDSLISASQVKELRRRLKPGDLILERRNWYLSNAFLPGYWPHSALYVGSPEDLKSLGLDRDPRVQRHWNEFAARDQERHERLVLEAISEGVVFTSLEHSVGEADSVAVLRPRVPPEQVREAIARAFSHRGKPYDFEFDFFSTDKLVCSELVFRAYDGAINFPLVDVLGRKTLPPIELVRQCVQERGTARAQFDFVAFLDGSEKTGRAEFANEETFFSTATRPALTWQQR